MDWHQILEYGRAHLERGGFIMLVIAGLSVWMWALIGMKWYMLLSSRKHEQSLTTCLHCFAKPDFTPAPWQKMLVAAAVESRKMHTKLRRRFLTAQADTVAAGYTRHTNTILMLAGVAPLLGLLGTVTGMIETFDVIALHGTGNAKGLAGGISVALITTQAGLVAAVPGLVLGRFLRRRALKACERIDRFTIGLLREAERGNLDQLARVSTPAREAAA